jgi:hypothetical protein
MASVATVMASVVPPFLRCALGAVETSGRRGEATRTQSIVTHRPTTRRSLPVIYLIYLAFQVEPEDVGGGGIY